MQMAETAREEETMSENEEEQQLLQHGPSASTAAGTSAAMVTLSSSLPHAAATAAGADNSKRPAPPETGMHGSPSKSKRVATSDDIEPRGKAIRYLDANGRHHGARFANDDEFRKFCSIKKIDCLIDEGKNEIYGFEALCDGAAYTLTEPSSAIREFDLATLCQPKDVLLPPIDFDEPPFVCQDGWKRAIADTILEECGPDDSTRPGLRVRPLALVGCSRSGKTRALKELAHYLKQSDPSICIIFITFNDYSHVEAVDETDPLHAFCKRIAFASSKDRHANENWKNAYTAFCKSNVTIEPRMIEKWLGESPAILLIDELNSLTSASAIETDKAKALGDFVRNNFLNKANCFFLFSSHVLTMLRLFVEVLDRSIQSDRRVLLRSLPNVTDLAVAGQLLGLELRSRVAIYYGLLPAMIYVQLRTPGLNSSQANALSEYNSWDDAVKVESIRKLCNSLFSGDIAQVPTLLHPFLVTRGEDALERVQWIPYFLQKVLETLSFADNHLTAMTTAMAGLLDKFKDARDHSGEGWETLFNFQLLAHCIAQLPSYNLVPNHWFQSSDVAIEFNRPDRLERQIMEYSNCFEVLADIKPTKAPTIFIFLPEEARFKELDVIVFYWKHYVLIDFYGYQLKDGTKMPKTTKNAPTASIASAYSGLSRIKCFWLRGQPLATSGLLRGWEIPSDEAINGFFGESGRSWTPTSWAALEASGGMA